MWDWQKTQLLFPINVETENKLPFFFWYIRDWDYIKSCDQKKVKTEITLIHGKMPKLSQDHVLRSWIEAENCTFSLKNCPFLGLFCLFFVFAQPWMFADKIIFFSTRLRFFRFFPPDTDWDQDWVMNNFFPRLRLRLRVWNMNQFIQCWCSIQYFFRLRPNDNLL